MSGDLLEKSINQWSWREWLKRGNLLFMALTKTNTNFIRFLFDYFVSLRPKAIDQPIESTINL